MNTLSKLAELPRADRQLLMEATAWLEFHGRVLVGDHELHRYAPLEQV